MSDDLCSIQSGYSIFATLSLSCDLTALVGLPHCHSQILSPWPHGIVNCPPYPHFRIFWKYQVNRVLSAHSFMSIANSDIHLLLHAVQGCYKPLWSPKQNCIWRPLGAANMVGYRQSLIIHT